jgi:predicted ferric reductase
MLGISAAVLLAVSAILAVRLRPLEWLFGDTTQVYVAHAVIGLTMFGLVTIHPLLYVLGLLPSLRQGGQVLVPFQLVALDWVSYLLITAALLPTLYVRLRYDLWRFTHLLLGGAVVVTMVSLVLTSRQFDTYQILALRIYLLVLFAASIGAIAYVAVIRRFAEPKHQYRVTHVEHFPAAKATELHLKDLQL